MLVLSRKNDQSVRIGNQITIKVLAIKGKSVSLGIEAPHEMRILRGELHDWPTSECAAELFFSAKPQEPVTDAGFALTAPC